jgi:outer membrane lipoprotein SlyB
LAISTYEDLLANSNQFLSGDLCEEVEQLKVNRDKNNKIVLGFAGATIAGMAGTAIGAIGQAVVKDKGEVEIKF